jgi:hypothetical protein
VGWLVLARAVALAHLAFVVFLVCGGPLSLRWRRLLPLHLTGLACPLTGLEKDLLERSGRGAYRHGFVEHHLVEPIHPSGASPTVTLVLIAIWLVPTLVAYGVMVFTRSSRRQVTIAR